MTLFPDRAASAVVVVDAQAGIAAGLPDAGPATEAIAGLVARARLAGVAVVWLRRVDATLQVGEPDWQLVDALVPEPTEVQLDHRWDDSFIETQLAQVLGGLEAGHLWLAGLGSDTAVLHTYLGALHRGFDVTLVEDAHAAPDAEFDGSRWPAGQVAAFVNRIVWRDLAPDVTGDLMASDNVVFTPDEPDDEDLIALAEAEVAQLEDTEDDLASD